MGAASFYTTDEKFLMSAFFHYFNGIADVVSLLDAVACNCWFVMRYFFIIIFFFLPNFKFGVERLPTIRRVNPFQERSDCSAAGFNEKISTIFFTLLEEMA